MPPKTPAPGTPQEWLAFAKSSLALARQPKPEEALWEDHCFLAHQAVEKALKAVYQHRGQLFEFIHDLKKLGRGLEQGGLRIPPEIREAFRLTKYVLESRYPGTIERVTEKEYKETVALAEAAVKWAEKMIKTSGDFPGSAVHETPAVYGARPKKKRKTRGKK